ncbi:MAG TPA: aminotransferase class V-fold PLP-dependent enzyme [Candidatus Limnocylindrales bacterium]|nr:aminotransferase class V-fold PLP-dependent enzyme [Candidatus Limnocylindrales bacterium]
MVAPFLPDDEKVAAVREALPALAAGIYLNTGSVGPLPAETAAAMAEIADHELRFGRASMADWDDFLERLAEARAAVAAIIGADVDEVAITHSTTAGLNAAISSVDLRPGDRILTTEAEHAGGFGAIHAAAARTGADVAVVDVTDPADAADDDAVVARFESALSRATRVVAVSDVLWTTGARLPIAGLAELAHARGAVVVVDGAQAAGAVPVNVGDLGVDFYSVPGQKWLLGPEGTGALWASPSATAAGRVSLGSAFSYERADEGGAVPWPDARRFDEPGHFRAAITGLARSCGWLSMYVGLPWIHARGAAMARRAADRLAAIRGVELLTPRYRMATLVTFRVDGWTSDAALAEIAGRTFAIARTVPPLDAIRLSIGFFTTADEIERVATVVELLAAHTPDTLPKRPKLTIIDAAG